MFQRLKYGLQRFMTGRNGGDALGWVVLLAGLACSLTSALTGQPFWQLLALIGLAYSLFRVYSRNVPKRQEENAKFVGFFRRIKTRLTDRTHRYYRCPQCKQTVRVPKGKGKISIRCPHCQTRFEKTT